MNEVFICDNCDHVFTAGQASEKGYCTCIGYMCSGACGVRKVCPMCESEDYEVAVQCDRCGEYYHATDMVSDLCEDCAEKEEEDKNE